MSWTNTAAILYDDNGRFGIISLLITKGGTLLGKSDASGEANSPCQTPLIGQQLFLRSVAETMDNRGYRLGFIGVANDPMWS